MKCVECPYCWKGEDDDYACCHYVGDEAPCEWEEEEEEEEEGFLDYDY